MAQSVNRTSATAPLFIMEDSCQHLFVYGSLKRSFGHAMHRHIRKYATFVDIGSFQGKLYRIDWYPGVVDSDEAHDQVKGEVYHMHQPDALLAQLDAFELYRPDRLDLSEYLRVLRPISTPLLGIIQCHVYLYHRTLVHATPILSGIFEPETSSGSS